MKTVRRNPYCIAENKFIVESAESHLLQNDFHTEFGIPLPSYPKSFRNNDWWMFGGRTKKAFPAFILLRSVGWEHDTYDEKKKKGIDVNYGTGTFRTPVSAHSNQLWKITLEYVKTENIHNDNESMRIQKQSLADMQKMEYESDRIAREFDRNLAIERQKEASEDLRNYTKYNKQTRQAVKEFKDADDDNQDEEIAAEAEDAEMEEEQALMQQAAQVELDRQESELAKTESQRKAKLRAASNAKKLVQQSTSQVDVGWTAASSPPSTALPDTPKPTRLEVLRKTNEERIAHEKYQQRIIHAEREKRHVARLYSDNDHDYTLDDPIFSNGAITNNQVDEQTLGVQSNRSSGMDPLKRQKTKSMLDALHSPHAPATSSHAATQQQAQTRPRHEISFSKRGEIKSTQNSLNPPHATAAHPLASKPHQEHATTLAPGLLRPLRPPTHPGAFQPDTNLDVNTVKGRGQEWNPGVAPLQNKAERAAGKAAQAFQDSLDRW